MLALGGGLGIPLLAEGVQTEEQLTFLREQGCDEVQGFLLGRPGVTIASAYDRPDADEPAQADISRRA